MNCWSQYFLSMLRIVAGFVYGVHGTQKLFGFPAPFPVPHLFPLFLAGGISRLSEACFYCLGSSLDPSPSSFPARWPLLT